MIWHYDLHGAEPIIRDEPVFDGRGTVGVGSVTINAGALVGIGAAAVVAYAGGNGAGGGFQAILAYDATVNSMATNCLGVCLETPYSSGTSSSHYGTASATKSAGPFAKVIINPGAVYRAEQLLDASNDIAVTRVSSTTVESVAAGLYGHWVYFPTTNSNVIGSLRYLYVVNATSGGMSHTLSGTATTSDAFVVVYPKYSAAPALDSTARYVTCSTAAITGSTTNLRIAETYIDRGQGLELMRAYTHSNLDDLHLCRHGNGPKFYYDLVMKSHIYGNSI